LVLKGKTIIIGSHMAIIGRRNGSIKVVILILPEGLGGEQQENGPLGRKG
jgi:hypothetical protein